MTTLPDTIACTNTIPSPNSPEDSYLKLPRDRTGPSRKIIPTPSPRLTKNLAELGMRPGDAPDAARVRLPMRHLLRGSVLGDVPHLDALIGRASCHTPTIMIVCYIVDQVFMLSLHAFCHEHFATMSKKDEYLPVDGGR